ncbi:MAG: type II toxin-antitoxin system RelE/ParE family toxin [Coriobacteriia bacterium]|nr:type II toxin-antitoxin system RelE/ParE family toxin [Coriobacteriia bacterium]
MRIVYSESAIRDLERIRDFFLASDIQRAEVESYIKTIDKDINRLQNQPKLGFSVGEKYGFATSYRGLVVWDGRYLATYELEPAKVKIMRIYSTKENYIKDLLP